MTLLQQALSLTDLPPAPQGRLGWPWTKESVALPKLMDNRFEWPLISVITPSYNQGHFIEETIRSVLLQGYPNLEYIIIDGGSSDNTIDVIKKYEKFLTYWISEKDTGQTDAINKGIRRTSGAILGWINSDDLYVKGAFQKVAKAFHKNKGFILVHGNRILINEVSKVTGWVPLPPFNPETTPFNVCSETAFWRRDAMEKVGFLKEDLRFAMDLEFFGRLYLYGTFLKLDDYLGCFRCHSLSKSSTIFQIGRAEANKEWENLFGCEFPNRASERNNWILLKDLMKNPLLIALPYISYKLSKWLFSPKM